MRDEVEVSARLRCPELRHLPLADEVGAGNDLAAGGLPEYFGQANFECPVKHRLETGVP